MRVDAFDKPGGDVELMRTYIRYCQQAAQEKGMEFEGEILTDLHPDLKRFDVVHLTNTDRPFDLYEQFLAAKHAGRPTVITPLHHSYREIERYERIGRGGLVGIFSRWMGFNRLEVLRTLIKSRQYSELWPALRKTLRVGIQAAQAEVLRGCCFVFVASDKEAADIASEIVRLPAERIVKVRNGFRIPDTPPVSLRDRDIDIAVVARVEARKNQLAILDAVESLGLKAVFVGPPNPNHKRYVRFLKKRIAESQSTYIPGVPAQEVPSILARARMHVAASWFEVSSLVDIDAYVLGCRVVASQCGGTSELLGDDAYYVDPGSTKVIAQKIAAAWESVQQDAANQIQQLRDRLETWEEIAVRLLALYGSSISHCRSMSSATPTSCEHSRRAGR